MNSSFQTPSPTSSTTAVTGQMNSPADNSSDQFIEKIFGPTSTGGGGHLFPQLGNLSISDPRVHLLQLNHTRLLILLLLHDSRESLSLTVFPPLSSP